MKYLPTLTLLLTIVLFPWAGFNSAQAQETFGNFGITTPSQRFSEEGREQLEREIRRLQTSHPDASHPDSKDLLTIDDSAYIQEDLIQEDLIRLEDPRFYLEHLPINNR